jgi:hypothetical protein
MANNSFGRWRNPPYKPGQRAPYKISRSKIDLFIQCPRCFFLDARHKISRPRTPPFTLNSAVDYLLKLEFDIHRTNGKTHPLLEQYGIDARPVAHDKLSVWRENFKGVEAVHRPTNLKITGAIDDLWQDSSGNYIVVDYKSTSKFEKIDKLGEEFWFDQYRRQMEVYQWLLRQNGLTVSDTGYFIYCNAQKDKKAFDGKLEFELTLIPYTGNDGWIEDKLLEIKACLELENIPNPSNSCEYCDYIRQQTVAFAGEKKPKNALF